MRTDTHRRNFRGQRYKNHSTSSGDHPEPLTKCSLTCSLSFFPVFSLVCLRNAFPNSFSDKHILTALLWNHGKGPILSLQTHMCTDTHVRRTLSGLREECAAKVAKWLKCGLSAGADGIGINSTQSSPYRGHFRLQGQIWDKNSVFKTWKYFKTSEE